ncbi:MAG: transposase, partial [Betaproteobacteria bacterium]|nr:transposase [Betaproteobacteria bacterium]
MVVDPVRQRIVWVGEGKSSDTLGEFFKALGPERAKLLTHVTMDLSAAYRSSVSEHAPQAELVFDRFHIQRLASDAVDAVRRGEVRAAEDAETARSLKGTRWALLKSPWNLNAVEAAKLEDLQRANRRIFRAWLLKEKLVDILRRRQPGVAARARTVDWLGDAEQAQALREARSHHQAVRRRHHCLCAHRPEQRAHRGPQQQGASHHATRVRLPLGACPHRDDLPLLRRHHALAP